MGFHSLPIKRKYIDVPNEYCYLTIVKYKDDYLKSQDGKKLTKQQIKERKNYLIEQQETINQLDSGYCNLYNNSISLSTIFDSFFTSYLEGNQDVIIYKIKPLASYKNRSRWSSIDKYETSEFNVTARLIKKEDIINQIYKDGLLREFSATYFDNHCYANEGYNLKIFNYFQYVKDNFKDIEISLEDIMLTNDCYHVVRNKFNKKDTYEITRENIRYLLKNNLIEYFREDDYYKSRLIIGLIDCGLCDVALNCVKLLDEYYTKDLLRNKNFDIVLKKWSTDSCVKEIIKLLDITLSGLILTIKNDDNVIETKNFNNIGEVKTYLIKEYDIPFEKIANKDVVDIEFYNDNERINYSFEIN
jgi:hypothetical protein